MALLAPPWIGRSLGNFAGPLIESVADPALFVFF